MPVPTITLTHSPSLHPRPLKSGWVKSVEYRDGFLLVQMNDMIYGYVAPTWVAGLLRAWSSNGVSVGEMWRRLKDGDKWGSKFTVVAKFKAPVVEGSKQDLMVQLKKSLEAKQLELDLKS